MSGTPEFSLLLIYWTVFTILPLRHFKRIIINNINIITNTALTLTLALCGRSNQTWRTSWWGHRLSPAGIAVFHTTELLLWTVVPQSACRNQYPQIHYDHDIDATYKSSSLLTSTLKSDLLSLWADSEIFSNSVECSRIGIQKTIPYLYLLFIYF